MNILLILLLAVLVAVFVAGRSNPALKWLAAALAVAALVAVGVKEIWRMSHLPGAAEAVWDEAVGHALGNVIAKNHPDGGTVVVLDLSPGDGLSAYARARLAGLEKGWKPGPFTKAVVEAADVSAALGLGDGPQVLMPGMLTREAYAKLIAKFPGAVAVVSFLGVPSGLAETDAGALPPLYALDLTPPPVEAGAAAPRTPTVRALVRIRSNVDFTAPAPPGGPGEVFVARYERVTYAK